MRDPSGENAGSVATAVSSMILRSCARLARSAAYSWKRPVRELATTISPWTNTSATARLPPGAVAVTRAWPYDAVDTVPSPATLTTWGLSAVQETPVAGPITTPASSAKLAFSGYRRLSGRPSRAAESFKPAAITRICHVTISPGPGPLTTSVVFPARFPVKVPDAGSKPASDVSPTVQRNGASGTGLLSAVSACTWNFAVPWMGSGSSVFEVGKTVSASTVRCTRISTVFACSSPTTLSVVRPGVTAVTTPVRLTRAMPGSAADHCRASGLTNRPPCAGTITWRVSTSPGDMTRGTASWIAMSLGCTTTGAVAVRPPALVTCTVPWPGASATTTPVWSTLAMSGRSDFHVTVTGAAGEPSSLSARGDTRVFSDGRRYTVGGSIRSTAAGPAPRT